MAEADDRMPGIDRIFKNATKSIEDAEEAMSKARVTLERAKESKDGRSKIVSTASEVVHTLLEPAYQVANLLQTLGSVCPPCKAAGQTLQSIVALESKRRENDVRIVLLFVDMSTTLIVLGTLKPGFQEIQALVVPLKKVLTGICDTIQRFGRFSGEFYGAKGLKSTLIHLVFANGNKEELNKFHSGLQEHKTELNNLLTAQTNLITASNKVSLERIEVKINLVYGFFASLTDEKEDQAIEFVKSHGGEENVKNNDSLLDKLASKFGETITPNVLRAIKESADETRKQSSALFDLKFDFVFKQIERSTKMMMTKVDSGLYELISDNDMKDVWMTIATKQSNVKRRLFIDATAYHFNSKWRDNKVDHEDVWTKSLISKVHYHPAIGDAIDDDASGYISIEELNEFLHKKPTRWTVPEWIAYWAYGWDADNIFYKEKIEESYSQLEMQRVKHKNLMKQYLEAQKTIKLIAGSPYPMNGLEPIAKAKMNNLRNEWRAKTEKIIGDRLESVSFKVDQTSMGAICGSERIEATFLPLVSLILDHHIRMLGQEDVTAENIEEAISTIDALCKIAISRIHDLWHIWRRQRFDVNVQIHYYVNGLFQAYYEENRSDFQTSSLGVPKDGWNSKDNAGSAYERKDTPDTLAIKDGKGHSKAGDVYLTPTRTPIQSNKRPRHDMEEDAGYGLAAKSRKKRT
ncbi:uncharacterized protein FOMMEDRAFT_17171 [Fomitiporia mediterranea MF3/22]|uniref:uncharacterized protein n=1 Tax=Fomitiporia mediterranea (strain MF3/22) TaxID=694068 RepID=UPI0004408180|nr:uncharacterized protein FOMMEDRAFT_17171 [Fomitiporia mediterranea MF3/22]EJD06689.1 hypothetical protein FOMMEDRAFT_17171 [Fomitiporia mediterranea MF3/22]